MLGVLFCLGLLGTAVVSFPQSQGSPAMLYDDRTGRSYNHDFLASQVNQDLGLVPRMEHISRNEHQQEPVMEDRIDMEKIKEKIGKKIAKKMKGHPHRAPSHKMGPFMKYSQTYWNPFIYGGPNGPPTFIPSLGVWPLYNQGPEYHAYP